jgi:chemotaxis family two-component system response regulator Rcp1
MTPFAEVRSVEILLVEDSPTDALLAREAFEFAQVPNRLHLVTDGAEAIAFLRREGRHSDAPRPHVILLDLNLPKKDGREVLREIKSDDRLKQIPVIVLTTSSAETDILHSYSLHANCYIVKPVDFERFAEVVQIVESFWFVTVALPTGGST